MAGYIGTRAAVASPGTERKKTFAITTTTTNLTGLSYTPGFVHVYHNGIRLVDSTDYTATNGTSITLINAAENGDEVVVISYASFQPSDTVSASLGGFFEGNVTVNADLTVSGNTDINGGTIDGTVIGGSTPAAISGTTGTFSDNLTVDTDTLFVDATNNRVGIGTSSPLTTLDLGNGTGGSGITWGGPTGTTRYNSITSTYSGAGLLLSSLFHGSTSSDAYVTSFTGTYPASGIRLDWTNNNGIQFFTDVAAARTAGAAFVPTERMRINASGHLLIGCTGSFGTTGNQGLRPGSAGQLILGANSGGLYHQVPGSIYYLVSTAGGSTSDVNLKTNVATLEGALDKVCAIRGVSFEFIEEQMSDPDKGQQIGVIAQEVEAQYPEAVVTGPDGIKSVRYEKLVAPLIEAIKEQRAVIEALEARMAVLEGGAV